MAKMFEEISEKLKEFIENQKVYFVGTAGAEGKINVSPKGMDSLRVIDERTVVWLNLTGSGNETSAHVQENGRMTIMFCAFEGKPLILRLYGRATVIHKRDRAWNEYIPLFSEYLVARQIFKLDIELVQTSCGFAVPLYDYTADRGLLTDWAEKKGREGIQNYWKEKNQKSLDGKLTNILNDSVAPDR
jgi:hypothetical protein